MFPPKWRWCRTSSISYDYLTFFLFAWLISIFLSGIHPTQRGSAYGVSRTKTDISTACASVVWPIARSVSLDIHFSFSVEYTLKSSILASQAPPGKTFMQVNFMNI